MGKSEQKSFYNSRIWLRRIKGGWYFMCVCVFSFFLSEATTIISAPIGALNVTSRQLRINQLTVKPTTKKTDGHESWLGNCTFNNHLVCSNYSKITITLSVFSFIFIFEISVSISTNSRSGIWSQIRSVTCLLGKEWRGRKKSVRDELFILLIFYTPIKADMCFVYMF